MERLRLLCMPTGRDAARMPIFQKPSQRSLRRGRFAQTGSIYLVTTVVVARHPVFLDFSAAHAACFAFTNPSLIDDASLLAWVLMPDHAHWLVQSGERMQLDAIARHLKSASSRAANRQLGRGGPLWAAGYHDRALRREDDLRATARYVIGNPIRAGLVRSVGDYPFWNAIWL